MSTRSPITSHVLDTSKGKPASGVTVQLHRRISPTSWMPMATAITDADGRVEHLLPVGSPPPAGVYRLDFQTEEYFKAAKSDAFYPVVSVTFEIKNPAEHHHVPLLISPFGYSTYRGT